MARERQHSLKRFCLKKAHVYASLNADLIAAGLSPLQPELAAIRAGRVMLEEIGVSVGRMESFSFETTLAGRTYLQHIPRWRALGYHVQLSFLTLPHGDFAIQRVQSRVLQGGHRIPEDVIRRRFYAGHQNFEQRYKRCVNTWVKYDNSGSSPVFIEGGENT